MCMVCVRVCWEGHTLVCDWRRMAADRAPAGGAITDLTATDPAWMMQHKKHYQAWHTQQGVTSCSNTAGGGGGGGGGLVGRMRRMQRWMKRRRRRR